MKQYVLGIVTDRRKTQVLLIQKTAPEWQVGRLNGIGGKMESGETPHRAMDREWFEETGIHGPGRWDLRIRLTHVSREALVYFFSGELEDRLLEKARNTEGKGENLELRGIGDILTDSRLMDNLRWMIPMFLDDELLSQPLDLIYH
jgi:8-oxo-dGTP diphosphatase